MRNVVHGGLDAAAVARQLLDRDAADCARIQGIAPELEGIGEEEREVRHLVHKILPRKIELLGTHSHAAGGHKLVDILGELLYVFLRAVRAAAGLIHEENRVRLEIVRRRLEGFIQKRHIAVRRVQRQRRGERVRVLLEGAGEIGS